MISVIIPTHNPNLSFLQQTLNSLKGQIDHEVIIVENPEKTDRVKKLLENFDFIHESSQQGANKARNRGAEVSRGEFLLFVDDDIILSENLLEAYVCTQKATNGSVIGGPVHLRYIDGKPTWINEHFEGYLARLDYGTPYGMIPFEVKKKWELHVPLVSANMFFAKKYFNTYGGFDENEGYIGRSLLAPNDELGLLTRCSKRTPGMIYHPKAYVTHLVPKERTTPDYMCRRMYGQGVADFNSLRIMNPNLSKLDIYEKIILEHNSLVINDVASFYCLFENMNRVNRLYATKVYHQAKTDYVRGILSQLEGVS